MNGFIKIHRQLLKWEWYQDINVKTLFLHLLLKANFEDSKWQGKTIERGQVVIGLKSLNKELGLSVQQIRTALTKLKNTQEITTETTNKYTLVTIVNYDKYQDVKDKSTSNSTNEQQTDNKPSTTSKELKELKEVKKENIKRKKYFDNKNLNDTFLEFLEHRKKLKAVNSERAINTLLNILKDFDDEKKIELIDKSIVNSWKSIFPQDQDKKPKEPKWLNQEIEIVTATDDEIANLLKEFK